MHLSLINTAIGKTRDDSYPGSSSMRPSIGSVDTEHVPPTPTASVAAEFNIYERYLEREVVKS